MNAPKPSGEGHNQQPDDSERIGEFLAATISNMLLMADKAKLPQNKAVHMASGRIGTKGKATILAVHQGDEETQLQLVVTETPKSGSKLQGVEVSAIMDKDAKERWGLSQSVHEPLTISWRGDHDDRKAQNIIVKFRIDESGNLSPSEQSGESPTTDDFMRAAVFTADIAEDFTGNFEPPIGGFVVGTLDF